MYELYQKKNSNPVLVWTQRVRMPFERGFWVEVGHEREKDIERIVAINKNEGIQVEKDEKGFFRALILKD